jgi:hypothetical protein
MLVQILVAIADGVLIGRLGTDALAACRTYIIRLIRDQTAGMPLVEPPRLRYTLMRVMLLDVGCVHHPQHVNAASSEEPPHEDPGQCEERDIEPRGIVPRNRCFDHLRMMFVRNSAGKSEQAFDDKGGCHHRSIEGDQKKDCHPQTVILAIDVQHRQHDQVSQDEGEHAAKTDTAVPQDRRERDISLLSNHGWVVAGWI